MTARRFFLITGHGSNPSCCVSGEILHPPCESGKNHVGLSRNTINPRFSGLLFKNGRMDFFRFLFSRGFLKHFLGMIAVAAVLVWIVLFALRIYTQHGKYLTVPDYTGKLISEVMGGKESEMFEFVVIDSVFELNKPKGMILHQDPFPDSKVKENRKIYLTIVSFLPEKTSVPDLKFLTLRQAISTLESIGLKVGKIQYIPTFDADAVQQQRYKGEVIAPGTRLDKGSSIDLTVGMGSKGQVEIRVQEENTDSM
jgi:eukaryotic-like serine/threonine-protein kinase